MDNAYNKKLYFKDPRKHLFCYFSVLHRVLKNRFLALYGGQILEIFVNVG